MNAASKIVAMRIKASALRELQAADELGGPDFSEYIELMEEMSFECKTRANTARATWRDRRRGNVLAWFREHVNDAAAIIDTGGGCTAIYIPIGTDGTHWLITDDADAPEAFGPVVLGYYRRDMEDWITFDCKSIAQCADIIRAAFNHS
jgi:hypothetical protein